jgi:tetratricopeptide (TPR) repeat protein
VERLQAARLLLALGDAEAATAVAEAALRESPPEPAPFWVLLAEAHRKAGRALAEADALAHAAPLLPVRQRAPLWARRAELLRDLGDRAGEREALSQAIVSERRDEALLRALHDACLALGDAEGACDALELELDAAHGDRSKVVACALELGRLALEKLHHPQRAEAAFRRALAQAPEERTALKQLASIVLTRGEVREGLDLLRRDCDAEPDPARSAEQRLRLAELAWREHGDPEIALAQVRRVLESEPGSLPATQLAAELLYSAGASTEAVPLLQRLVAEPWDDQPEVLERYLLWLADAEAATGDLDAARRSLERLMAERPSHAAAERWAELSREWPDAEASQRLQERAVLVDSHRGRAVLLAEAAQRLARSDPATGAKLLRQALEIDPRPDLSDSLQRLLEAAGDRAGLADELARAAGGAEGAERVAL